MSAAIEIANLSFRYPDGQPALCGINLTINSGERVALLGPNGAGKSTLLMHLNGILQGSGEVRILGLPVVQQNFGRIRARVGMVFQSPDEQLFSPTVFDDVAYGPIYQGLSDYEVEIRVRDALSAVGMESYSKRMPHRLSLGEKKRIAIATVLSMQPEILAFDEPTAGLDPRARRSLIELLANFPHTLLVATQDLDLARDLLGRTVVLAEGQVVMDCPTADLLRQPDELARLGLR